ncbi:hypothetical protein Ga0609869_002748 [Rhodovulum iodosum]|uniref:Alpha/beta hydrolase n=1 Tax=Rhodovulum iodosum TaxID=68291 RepID=A0ABV3XVL7_9RHOB|nr:hypothetical protein [Rhodovulum robiginosum]RSK33437.1 hypothetical protein EJA01_09045 [Rhodovulum robiginosum]
MTVVLMLGSGPSVTACRAWPRAPFDRIVAINNAWRVRPDWDDLVTPYDFPPRRMPPATDARQRLIREADFIPAVNAFGGIVYAGATMTFTAAYWALFALRPKVIGFLGCDMVYPTTGPTHFYGQGTPDPLRADVTLQSLEAKAARLMICAARQGCALVNLSRGPSRLVFPRGTPKALAAALPLPHDGALAAAAGVQEAALGYRVPSGRYWDETQGFDAGALSALDALWLAASGHRPAREMTA